MSSALFSLFKQVKIAQFLAQELWGKEFQTLQLNVVNKKLKNLLKQVPNHINIFLQCGFGSKDVVVQSWNLLKLSDSTTHARKSNAYGLFLKVS